MGYVVAGITAICLNLAFWRLFLLVQEWESRTGRIPPRKKRNPQNPSDRFLYAQDFATVAWGDTIGLSLVDLVVGTLAYQGEVTGIAFWLPILASVVVTGFFLAGCMAANHKPDAGYPEKGKISWQGKVHLLYFAVQVTAIGIAVLALLTGKLSVSLTMVGIPGGAIYGAAFLHDVLSGKFAWD